MKSPTIQSYVSRLISCGIPKHEALRTVCSFLKEFDETELRKYVESIEKDKKHVDQIQCQSCGKSCGGLCLICADVQLSLSGTQAAFLSLYRMQI